MKHSRYIVKLKNDAVKDLINIYYYISIVLIEPLIANRLISKILNDITILEYYPEAFQKVGNLSRIRRLIVKNYNILYFIDTNIKRVYVLHIYHKSKNIKIK